MPSKHKQMVEAYFAGLNQKYYDVKYDLKYPDGSEIPSEKLYQKRYNINHCTFCSNQNCCNGCTLCGNCTGEKILLSTDDFKQFQQDIIAQGKQSYFV